MSAIHARAETLKALSPFYDLECLIEEAKRQADPFSDEGAIAERIADRLCEVRGEVEGFIERLALRSAASVEAAAALCALPTPRLQALLKAAS